MEILTATCVRHIIIDARPNNSMPQHATTCHNTCRPACIVGRARILFWPAPSCVQRERERENAGVCCRKFICTWFSAVAFCVAGKSLGRHEQQRWRRLGLGSLLKRNRFPPPSSPPSAAPTPPRHATGRGDRPAF